MNKWGKKISLPEKKLLEPPFKWMLVPASLVAARLISPEVSQYFDHKRGRSPEGSICSTYPFRATQKWLLGRFADFCFWTGPLLKCTKLRQEKSQHRLNNSSRYTFYWAHAYVIEHHYLYIRLLRRRHPPGFHWWILVSQISREVCMQFNDRWHGNFPLIGREIHNVLVVVWRHLFWQVCLIDSCQNKGSFTPFWQLFWRAPAKWRHWLLIETCQILTSFLQNHRCSVF